MIPLHRSAPKSGASDRNISATRDDSAHFGLRAKDGSPVTDSEACLVNTSARLPSALAEVHLRNRYAP